MLKKCIILVTLFVVSLIPLSVYADCECSISDCNSCGCVLNEDKNKCIYPTFEKKDLTSCGGNSLSNIPSIIPKITHIAYNVVLIVVPVLLVVFGSIDLVKGVIAAKEDEIKKGQQVFIKRLISGVLVFFVLVVVKFVVSLAANENSGALLGCAECFIEGKCD